MFSPGSFVYQLGLRNLLGFLVFIALQPTSSAGSVTSTSVMTVVDRPSDAVVPPPGLTIFDPKDVSLQEEDDATRTITAAAVYVNHALEE